MIAVLASIFTALGAALGAACGGASTEAKLDPLPASVTRATLVGPLCDGAECRCREQGDDIGAPERAGLKRFEIRLGPTANELWATLGNMVLYKAANPAEACFYVDLPAGKYPVSLRAQGKPGFGARLVIAETGPKGLYDTFLFSCGAPGDCDLAELRDWQASLARYPRHVHDPCGSTKIRDIDWKTGYAPDRAHPTELQLELVLDVYQFAPKHESGHPACANNF